MKRYSGIIYMIFLACTLFGSYAYAEPTISDTPYEEISTANEPETTTSETAAGPKPQAETTDTQSSQSSVIGPQVSTQSGAVTESYTVTLSDEPTTEEYNEVGQSYSQSPTVGIDLGFQIVSPAHEYSGFKVAEGSVQLSDGSWAEIGYDKLIRGGYYRLLREATDSTGTGWYIVAVNASRIGNYYTPDGSRVTELWLKKNDCTLSGTLSVNTSNTTRQNIVRTALSLAGSQYVYGGNGPDSFDCSGFVKYVMAQNGITVPRTSSEICAAGTEVGISGLRPGDIVGRSGHVGIYLGNGYFIHSSESSTGVVVESVAVYNRYSKFTSYVNVVGD